MWEVVVELLEGEDAVLVVLEEKEVVVVGVEEDIVTALLAVCRSCTWIVLLVRAIVYLCVRCVSLLPGV